MVFILLLVKLMAYKTVNVLSETYTKLREHKLKRSLEEKKDFTFDQIIRELLGENITKNGNVEE